MASWGEDLRFYEQAKRGPLSSAEYPPRYPRTVLCPLGDVRNPTYHLPVEGYQPSAECTARFSRHGWGALHPSSYVYNPVLQRWTDPKKEEALAGAEAASEGHTERRLVPGAAPGAGANRPPMLGVHNPTGRKDLFDTLQHGRPTETSSDAWMGNALVDPSKGKLPARQSTAHGRQDLFDVLNQTGRRKPGDESRDAWIGNRLIDPAAGKRNVEEPDNRKGRKDLFDIMAMGEPIEGDKSFDAWLGHLKVDPLLGRGHGASAPDKSVTREEFNKLMGNEFAAERTGPSEKAFLRAVPNKVKELMTSEPLTPEPHTEGRRHLYPPPNPLSGRADLFGIMQMNEGREGTLKDENPTTGRKHYVVPGSNVPGKGVDLLYWS